MLTLRLRQVIRLVALGCTRYEVANILGLTEKTIDTNLTRIKDDTGLSGPANLARFAIRHGIIDIDEELSEQECKLAGRKFTQPRYIDCRDEAMIDRVRRGRRERRPEFSDERLIRQGLVGLCAITDGDPDQLPDLYDQVFKLEPTVLAKWEAEGSMAKSLKGR